MLLQKSNTFRVRKLAASPAQERIVEHRITAIVLLVYGTGSVQGFAKTLLLGVIVSMFSAIVITRLLMTWFVKVGLNKPAMYCTMTKNVEEEQK